MDRKMSRVSPGAKGIHLTPSCPANEDLLYSAGCSVDARGIGSVSLEARVNVRAAMEAVDLSSLPQTQDGDGVSFY